VVVAAALIMTSIFASFLLSGDANHQIPRPALAVGVACDALAVRMTIVPAVLALAGKHAWHIPRWLDRVLPDLDIEGTTLPPADGSPRRRRESVRRTIHAAGVNAPVASANAPEDSGRCTGHLPDDIATPSGQSAAGAEGSFPACDPKAGYEPSVHNWKDSCNGTEEQGRSDHRSNAGIGAKRRSFSPPRVPRSWSLAATRSVAARGAWRRGSWGHHGGGGVARFVKADLADLASLRQLAGKQAR